MRGQIKIQGPHASEQSLILEWIREPDKRADPSQNPQEYGVGSKVFVVKLLTCWHATTGKKRLHPSKVTGHTLFISPGEGGYFAFIASLNAMLFVCLFIAEGVYVWFYVQIYSCNFIILRIEIHFTGSLVSYRAPQRGS